MAHEVSVAYKRTRHKILYKGDKAFLFVDTVATSDQMVGISALVATPHIIQRWRHLRAGMLPDKAGGTLVGAVALATPTVSA